MEQPVSNEVLATGAAVLWKAQPVGQDTGLLAGAGSDAGGLLVVAATAEQATRLAGASARGKISVVLEGRG
jgi:hypothetical protein